MTEVFDTVVIGGGQAGLVSGYYLQKRGLRFTILEAQSEIGGAWLNYWDSVRLFSAAKYSSMDGMAFPGDPHHYPDGHEVVAYLKAYAAKFDLPVQLSARVDRVEKHGNVFETALQDGRRFQSGTVIVATGPFNKPHVPDIPGKDAFNGRTLHSYDYDTPDEFAGQRVVVVGSNNSAVQVACELATVAQVSLAVRKEIKFTPTHVLGKDIFFWIHDTGLDMLPIGCRWGTCVNSSVYDSGRYEAMVKAGNPQPKPMFTRFTQTGVVWGDGTAEDADTVLFATGFDRRNLPFLKGLGALNDVGEPLFHRGESETVPGLYYVGLEGVFRPASATLRGVSTDARIVTRKVRSYLHAHSAPSVITEPAAD